MMNWPDRLVEYCIDPAPLFNFIRDFSSDYNLFESNRGVLNIDDVCLKFSMNSSNFSDLDNPEILTESTGTTGYWASVAGDESSYSSSNHVYFFQRTLNFTVNMNGISIPSV